MDVQPVSNDPHAQTSYEIAERAVLGSLLIDPQTSIRQCVEHIGASDFGSPWMGAVYDLICHMFADGEGIDPITVYAKARERGVKIPGDAVTLHDVMQSTPTAANCGFYARQVGDAAARRRLHIAGVRMQQIASSETDLSDAMTHARIEWERVSDQGSGRLEAKTLADVLSGSDEYDWVIPDLLERQDRLILTGGEGAGKSTMVRQFAICASAGVHPFTHQQIEPVRVLVVDAENSEKQWRRAVRGMVAQARKIGTVDPAQAVRLVTGPLDMTNERHIGAVHRLIDDYKPDLLFIGPIYKLVPKAITNDDDAAPLIATLDGLRHRDLAMVMEAHAPKAIGLDGKRNLAPRGSAALQGWPEFGLGLRLMGEEWPRTAEVVHWRGDRDEGRGWPPRLRAGGLFPWTDDRLEPVGGELQGIWKPRFGGEN
jgi:replicative DNA helicase